MKKLLFGILFFMAPAVFAKDYSIDSNLVATSTNSTITLSAPGTSKTNCLTNLVVYSTGPTTLRTLNGNTTNFTLVMLTSTTFQGFWAPDFPLCADSNTALTIKSSAGGDGININYSGFVRK